MSQEKGLILFVVTVLAAFFLMSRNDSGKKALTEMPAPEQSSQKIAKGVKPSAGLAHSVRPRELALALSPRVGFSNDKMSGSIQQKGLCIDDWDLKDYKLSLEQPDKPLPLLTPAGSQDPMFVSFGWVSTDPNTSTPNETTFWDLAKNDPRGEGIVLKASQDNVDYTCEITVDDLYMASVTLTVCNKTKKALQLGGYGRVTHAIDSSQESSFVSYEGPLGYINGGLREDSYKDVDKSEKSYHASAGDWAGFSSKYWLTAILPDVKKHAFSVSMSALEQKKMYAMDVVSPTYSVAPGESQSIKLRVFVGPKQQQVLSHYASQGATSFDQSIDYGYFYFITKPVLMLLTWLYSVLQNFGLVIIVLTVCIRLALFPLARKSHQAMLRMKLLQPKLKRLQDMYAGDRVRLQQEMAQFYREQKINPASGCLPLLIQMPIFFALYKVLFISIEMRQAPFFWWLKDLSQPDPTSLLTLFGLIPIQLPSFMHIGVLPLLMGLTMYWQQKTAPQSLDANQQKVMQFLPLLFVFMLSSFPAGLTLYWTVSNVLSIAQQRYLNRHDTGRVSK